MQNWKRIWGTTRGIYIRQLIGFVVLPNLPFLLVRVFVPTDRSIVSLDYLGIGALAALLPSASTLVTLLFIAVFVLDVMKTFAGVYYFSFTDALRETGNLIHVSPWLTVPRIVLVIGIGYLICWLAMRISRNIQPRMMLQSLGIISLGFVSISLACSRLPNRKAIADSNLVSEVRAAYAMLYPAPTPPVQSASKAILHLLKSDAPPAKVVLIIEEAVGMSKNPAITNKVLSPLLERDVAARYDISRGQVAFRGPTLMGELREFCQAYGNPEDLFRITPELGKTCLPAKLRNAGFTTTAVHGFTKMFFDREAWYPLIGFQHLVFREELGTSAGTCGFHFPGACDPKLSLLVHKLLVHSPRNQKQFIYWLTLNSHEPVTDETAKGSNLRCEDLPEFGGRDICNMVRVQFNTNEAIERLVTAPDLPPTLFLIVGDHAPPLIDLADRQQWDQNNVPWVMLKPKMEDIDQEPTESTAPFDVRTAN